MAKYYSDWAATGKSVGLNWMNQVGLFSRGGRLTAFICHFF